MKARYKPQVWSKYTIIEKRENAGYIQLVSYLRGNTKPHIEFFLDERYRNKGIMGRELPKYLKKCKKYGNSQLNAITCLV